MEAAMDPRAMGEDTAPVPASAPVPPAPGRQRFSETATLTVGLAATAMPFARSSGEQAELWLRILRVHGAVGTAMQSLGVPERPLCIEPEAMRSHPCRPDALDAVIAGAATESHERGADAIATQDLLVGVIATYGEDFAEVLAVRGTTPAEVLERLGAVRATC
jgi:hypothetical protein